MKYLILPVLLLSTFINCNAQSKQYTFNYDNFEKEILTYKPEQNEVSDKDYEHERFYYNA